MDLTNIHKEKKTRRNRLAELNNMVYGKVPPQAKELEEAILGAIMLVKGCFDVVSEYLKAESFYADAHKRIFKAMISLSIKGSPIDALTVTEELRFKGELDLVGGPYYITKLTNHVVSSAHVEAHCRIVLQKAIQRELIRIGSEVITEAYEDSTDVFDLLDKLESDVYGIVSSGMGSDSTPIDVGIVEVVQDLEEMRHKEEGITGVPTGFPGLDSATYGWQNTDLIILAARPAVGKTAFALNLARNAALDPIKPVPVAVFSLEMSRKQLIQRMMSSESEIWLEKITRGKMDEQEMHRFYSRAVQRLSQAPIFIDDKAGLNMFELRAKARRLSNKNNIGLIIIDYLQLMTGDSNKSENREREISKISRELKKLAKDLNVPIIALSQLSREVEKRKEGQKVPQLSDLRESGAIEQDADMVIFLYRPSDDEIRADPDLRDTGMVKIAKHRHGKLKELVFAFKSEIQKWKDLDTEIKQGAQELEPGKSPVSLEDSGAKLYIQAGSKMNNGVEDEDPF